MHPALRLHEFPDADHSIHNSESGLQSDVSMYVEL